MTQSEPAGFFRALSLLLRIQIVRSARQLTGGIGLFRKKKAEGKREAAPPKSRNSWLFGGFVALSMLFAFSNIAYRAVSNIKEVTGTKRFLSTAMPQPGKPKAASQRAQPQTPPATWSSWPAAQLLYSKRLMTLPPAEGFALPPKVLSTLSFETFLFLIAITMLAIGNGELTRPDWDLEWLAVLPVPLTTLLWARVLGRAVTTQMSLFALLPLIVIVALEAGYGGAALFVGAAAALPLFLIVATIQTVCDTGLRLRLSPAQLRNLQAGLAVLSVVTLFFAMSPGMPSNTNYVVQLGPAMPTWLFWLPPGLAIQTVACASPQCAAQSLAILFLEAGLCAVLGIALLKRQLRMGIVTSGARESGRRKHLRKEEAEADYSARRLLTPIQARELMLLGRDRTFFVQTLIMPAIFVGGQIFLSGGWSTALASAHTHPEYLASIAFGISAYALMFSALQTLNAEGQALWILYTVPQPVASVIRQKALLWGTACLFYPAVIFTVAVATGNAAPAALLGLVALVVAGIPIFALIAASLGVFACDPLAQNVQRRVKVSYVYLYMLLSSIYVYCLYANTIWQRMGLVTLTALLAAALWQKARDQLPYLLDPAASPPARVSISDGLIAALLFFVIQGVAFAFRTDGGSGTVTGYDVLVAFSIAGGLTFGLMRLAFWRLHSQGVPRTLGAGAISAAGLGALGGIFAAGAAFMYLSAASHTPLLQQAKRTLLLGNHDQTIIAVLAIAAAPLFEEFIFRGLIFGGLRRSLGLPTSAVASAAIFAIVHPPASVIPVFGLGLITALVYERSRLLIAPLSAHAVYNALIVGFQGLF